MDIPNSKGRNGFLGGFRVHAEENRVPPDRSPFYVNWAKTFANFEHRKGKNSPGHGALVFLEKNIIKKGQARQDRREARGTCLREVPVWGTKAGRGDSNGFCFGRSGGVGCAG